MLRILFLIFIVSVAQLNAQTPATLKTFAEGIEKAKSENFESAAEKFRRVLAAAEIERASDDFLARAHFNLGACLYRLKQTEKSSAEFTEAIKLSRRKYQRAFYALGMAETALGNFDRAASAFRDALNLHKTDGEAWFDLGLIYLHQQDFERASEAFANAIRLGSINASDAHNNLGVIFAVRREFDRAETEFKLALQISKKQSAEAENNLLFCKYYRRQKERDNNFVATLKFSNKEQL